MDRIRKKSRLPSKRAAMRNRTEEPVSSDETDYLLPDDTNEDVPIVPMERRRSHAPLPSEVSFEDVPVFTLCNNCGEKVVTKTSFKRGKKMLCASVCLCLLQCYCCFWIPLVMDGLKDVVHVCPKCNKEIATYYRFQLPLFKEKVRDPPTEDENL